MPLRLLIAAASTIACVACGEAEPSHGPEADAARAFRPLGDVFFLPERVPLVTNDAAAKVPDSKIRWNVRAKIAEANLPEVAVTVREQIVVLEGSVGDMQTRDAIEKLALDVHGVAAVQNKLEVE